MSSAAIDLSAPAWTTKLAGLLENASLVMGRLDARISASSVRAAWSEQASWAGFAKARRAQGAEVEEIDIFALANGVSLPERAPIAFAEEEARALATWRRGLAAQEMPHWRDLAPYPLDLPADWRDRPALLRALQLVGHHAREDRTDAPWLASPALLSALGLTRTPLPCLMIADRALRLTPGDREAIVPRHLKRLARAAETGLERLDALEADRLRAGKVVASLVRPGGMTALLALLRRRPLISPLGVARALALSQSGAGKLLARAAEAGLVVEISGRTAWKLYLTPDLAVAFGYVARPRGRPPAPPRIEALDPVLARFDAEMAAIDERLAALDAR